MTDTPTIELLRAWRRGDRQALDRLIARNLEWVTSYVHRRLGPMLRRCDETQDLVQEAMADVLVYGPRFEIGDEDQFRGLLARIVENNIRDHHEWLGRARRSPEREEPNLSQTSVERRARDLSATTPSQAVDRTERSQWIRLALRMLDPMDRKVIQLREVEKLSFVEVGKLLGVGANAARMRFARAVPRLAQKVTELVRQGGSDA